MLVLACFEGSDRLLMEPLGGWTAVYRERRCACVRVGVRRHVEISLTAVVNERFITDQSGLTLEVKFAQHAPQSHFIRITHAKVDNGGLVIYSYSAILERDHETQWTSNGSNDTNTPPWPLEEWPI